jgi:putative phage-type endonuclease
MKLTIKKISKEASFDEWIAFRERGLGASEIGTLMGVNSWKSPAELYYQKIGLIPQKEVQNMPMFMGTILEQTVADIFEYWEESEEQMIKNHAADKKVRTLYNPNGYILNDMFPHLFFSPDRLIVSKDIRVRNETINLENVNAICEIKTISGWSSKQWDGGLPPSYYLQLQTYMMGLGVEKGYLVALEDGRKLAVHQFDADEEIISSIINISEEFWKRVELGREALQKGGDYDQYAPPPDGTEAYAEYLNERFANPEDKSIEATPEIESYVAEYLEHSREISVLEDAKRECANHIKTHMGHNSLLNCDIAKVTWRPNKNGSRVFRIVQ